MQGPLHHVVTKQSIPYPVEVTCLTLYFNCYGTAFGWLGTANTLKN